MFAPSRRTIATMVAVTSLTLAGCGGGSTTVTTDQAAADAGTEAPVTQVTVAHAQGETVVPVDPEAVVVFDLGALDTLLTLGVEVDGVPGLDLRALPDRFAGAADAEVVGSLFEPDYEAVEAMGPDLIIVGGRSSAVYDDLAALAPTIDITVDEADFIGSFTERVEVLGPIFGVEEEIEAELDAIAETSRSVEGLAADAGTALIVMTSGGEVTAYGPGSRFGVIHDVFGVAPAVQDVEAATHGESVSFEFLLDTDPEHLFVLDRDSAIGESGETAAQVLDNELVDETTAARNGDVHYLDSVAWYLAPNGLGSLRDMVGELEAALS